MHKLIPVLLVAILCPLVSAQKEPAVTGQNKFASWYEFTEAQRAYQRRDYQLALRVFISLAEKGNPEAQERVGSMYLWGEGVARDLAKAVAWLRKSADQGYASAQYWLGTTYHFLLDDAEAVKWYRKGAEQGYVHAQVALGLCYESGEGIQQNYTEAVRWYQLAAEQGNQAMATRLGFLYRDGEGVPQDYVRAHMWFNLAAAWPEAEGSGGIRNAREARDWVARLMTPQQIARAQEMAAEWESRFGSPPEPQRITDTGLDLLPQPASSGTGFGISREGHVLSNQHVVDGCRRVVVTGNGSANDVVVVATDEANDLSLLRLKSPLSSVLTFSESERPRLGQEVVVIGYPLRSILTPSVSLTTGVVSALSGPGGDTRLLQITAPVQPGNSGGPLLDSSGNVVGIVTSTIDALGVAVATGTIPQNVNFATKASTIRPFLDLQGVKYFTAPSVAKRETASLADEAIKAVVTIECWK
jgi:S1-C subfamily serine protease